jgi:hypothetical protein
MPDQYNTSAADDALKTIDAEGNAPKTGLGTGIRLIRFGRVFGRLTQTGRRDAPELKDSLTAILRITPQTLLPQVVVMPVMLIGASPRATWTMPLVRSMTL